MKNRFIYIILLSLFIIPLSFSLVTAQPVPEENKAPEWYLNPARQEGMIVVVSAAETFSAALVKGLGKIQAPASDDFESLVSVQHLGPITIQSMQKEFTEEVGRDQVARMNLLPQQ